jgi:hypothetical protein
MIKDLLADVLTRKYAPYSDAQSVLSHNSLQLQAFLCGMQALPMIDIFGFFFSFLSHPLCPRGGRAAFFFCFAKYCIEFFCVAMLLKHDTCIAVSGKA